MECTICGKHFKCNMVKKSCSIDNTCMCKKCYIKEVKREDKSLVIHKALKQIIEKCYGKSSSWRIA